MELAGQTRDERILGLMPLVHKLARKVSYKVPSADYQDLVSEGMVGAIQAVDRWNEDYGVELSTFAGRRISGQMYDYLRRDGPLSRDQWRKVVEGEVEFHLSSLDSPITSDDESSRTLIDVLPDDEDVVARMLDVLAMREIIRALPARHREVLVLYYYENLTLKQIGELYGVTESRVSQKMKAATTYAYRFLEEGASAMAS